MKIDYFFNTNLNSNFKPILDNFLKSEFFKENTCNKIIVSCYKNDASNLKYLKEKCKTNKKIKLIIFDKPYNYNNAFDVAIQFFDGDIVLLGDCYIQKIDVVFKKCLEKYKKGASVVHVVKKKQGFKNFTFNILSHIYNFFIKLFTNKKDRLNVISLGLIEKDFVDILKTLPKKRCFLKNTKDLIGFETRTIYVDEKTKTEDLDFKQASTSKTIAITGGTVSFISFVLLIVLSCTLNLHVVFLILLVSAVLVGGVLFSLFLPKHFFNVRNCIKENVQYKIKEIN